MKPRSDVIGSLLRPPELLDARASLERGDITAAEFKSIEDRAVDDAVALQEAAGLDVITDGEMRRYAFYGHLVEALEGFDRLGGWSITFRDGHGQEAALRRPVVVDRLRWRRQMSVEEFTYLRGRTSALVKITLVSAQQAAAYYDPDKSRAAYPTRDAYLADLVDFTRREITELGRLGCRYVQIDAPQYAALLDETIREGYRQRGSDPDRLLDACIELDNAIIDGHQGITFGIHICRGNHKSMFYASGSYDRIAARCSAGRDSTASCSSTTTTGRALSSRCDTFPTIASSCSAWSARRRRGWSPPTSCRLGSLKQQRIVPLERLALSPQCGFASTYEGNRLSADDQRRKLELVAQTAREVWGSQAVASR